MKWNADLILPGFSPASTLRLWPQPFEHQPVVQLVSSFDSHCLSSNFDRCPIRPVVFLHHWPTHGFIVNLSFKLLPASTWLECKHAHIEVRGVQNNRAVLKAIDIKLDQYHYRFRFTFGLHNGFASL